MRLTTTSFNSSSGAATLLSSMTGTFLGISSATTTASNNRNGRIDRKLQPNAEVYCHYFVYTDRKEDRILEVLVKKTETIKKELGSLSQVLEGRLAEDPQAGYPSPRHRRAAQKSWKEPTQTPRTERSSRRNWKRPASGRRT